MAQQIIALKTSLSTKSEVKKIDVLLDCHPQIIGWSIDLGDCDKVLRIVCDGITGADIVELLQLTGYEAEELN